MVHALVVVGSSMIAVAASAPLASPYPDPRQNHVACGNLVFPGTMETLLCDPDFVLLRALKAEQLTVAAAAIRAWEEDFAVRICGSFGVRAGIAFVTVTEEPLQRFAEDLAVAWALDDEGGVLVVLQAGFAPSVALAGGLLRDKAAFEAAPENWLEMMSRSVVRSLRVGVPGRAVEDALSGLADAIGGGLGHGMPTLAGGNSDVEQLLVDGMNTTFQNAEVWRTACAEHRCLELHLDGSRQFSERFERYYHEAMAFPALNILASSGSPPKRVLMLGGGDGGVATCVLEWSSIEHVTLLDIDADVAKLAKRNFPVVAKSFSDPRFVPLHVDAFQWVYEQSQAHAAQFDLAIIDFTDEPLESHWTPEFFQAIRSLLTPSGVLVQNIADADDRTTVANLRRLLHIHQWTFHSTYAMTVTVPDYMAEYSLALSSAVAIEPMKVDWKLWEQQGVRTVYYSPEVHQAIFATPPSILRMVEIAVEVAPGVAVALRAGNFEAPMTKWPLGNTLIHDEPDYYVYRSAFGHCDPAMPEGDCRFVVSDMRRYLSHYSLLTDEAATLPAMNMLGARARRVLVLGGGTGYVASLALQYPQVERVVVVDADEAMHRLVHEHFPTLAKVLRERRVEFIVAEPYDWIPGCSGEFDLIVNSIRHTSWTEASRLTRAPLTSHFLAKLRGLLAPHGMLAQEAGTIQTPRHTARVMALHRAAFGSGSVRPMAHGFDATVYAGLELDGHFARPPAFTVLSSPSHFNPEDVDWAAWRELDIAPLRYTPNWHRAIFAIPAESQRLFAAAASASGDIGSWASSGACSPPSAG